MLFAIAGGQKVEVLVNLWAIPFYPYAKGQNLSSFAEDFPHALLVLASDAVYPRNNLAARVWEDSKRDKRNDNPSGRSSRPVQFVGELP